MDEIKTLLTDGMRAVDRMLAAMDTLDAEFQKPVMCMFIDTWCAKNGYDLKEFYEAALEISSKITDEIGTQSWESYERDRKAWAEE